VLRERGRVLDEMVTKERTRAYLVRKRATLEPGAAEMKSSEERRDVLAEGGKGVREFVSSHSLLLLVNSPSGRERRRVPLQRK
jgi:hypothetical protein